MHIFIANAGEIAIKAVGRVADILTVIGQIIFDSYPREDLTKDPRIYKKKYNKKITLFCSLGCI